MRNEVDDPLNCAYFIPLLLLWAERLGEAFLDKASGLHIKFVARMLRPYKNRYSFPEITKEGSYQIRVDNPLIV